MYICMSVIYILDDKKLIPKHKIPFEITSIGNHSSVSEKKTNLLMKFAFI